MPAPSPIRITPQLLVFLSGLLLWSIRPRPELWTLVAAYFGAWLMLSAVGWLRGIDLPLTPVQAAFLGVILFAVPLSALYRQRYDVAFEEGIRGFDRHLADRVRLETLPAIAPPVIYTDHPQSFYVNAPRARQVRLALAHGRELESQALGEGLFRIYYDPRRHGPPPGENASIDVTLFVDGRPETRSLNVVRPEPHPRWFTSAPQLGLACTVSEETDEVFLLSREGLRHRFSAEDGPTDCVLVDGGRLLAVSHRYSPDLWMVEIETGRAVAKVPLGPFQGRLALDPEGDLLAVAMGGHEPGVRLILTASGREVGAFRFEFPPDWIAFGPSSEELIVSSAYRRSLFKLKRGDPGGDRGGVEKNGEWQLTDVLHLGRPAVTLGRAPAGDRLYVAVTDYREDSDEHRGNHFIQDQILTVDVESFRVIDQYLTARRSARQRNAGSIDRGASPMGITVRRDGSLLVAFAGTEEVWELDPDFARPPKMFWGLDLDLIAPHGVADLGDGFWAASSPAGGSMVILDRFGEIVSYIGIAATDSELARAPEGSLARQALVHRTGERAFYEATRSGISCQSCHLNADTDHSPHNIGQTSLLHTLTVRGVTSTSPYLRDGSFPRIRDLDAHLARILLRGYRRSLDRRGEMLEAYVEALPRPVNPNLLRARDLEDERSGVAAFVKAECTLCHTFPALTNLSRHPVRALFPEYGADLSPTVRLDTPSLLDVHAKSHFLQDGRAENLEAVLGEHNAANRHGHTAALSSEERRWLVSFLESL